MNQKKIGHHPMHPIWGSSAEKNLVTVAIHPPAAGYERSIAQ